MNKDLLLGMVDASDPTPRYLQAEQILANAIRSGLLSPGSKLPSTKDIGDLVNVSLITAHKALDRLVKSGLLRREIGRGTYVCDDVAGAMAAERRKLIGLVIDRKVNIDDYYHSAIIDGLRRESRDDQTDAEFFFHDAQSLALPNRRNAAGMICIHLPEQKRREVENLAKNVPVVALGGAFSNTNIPSVDCDNYEGAREAVRHLHDYGHRRFLLFAADTDLSNTCDRVRGAEDELSERNILLAQEDKLISNDPTDIEDKLIAQVSARLQGEHIPTAIVACGFYLALAAMKAVRQAGLSVPKDVSIVGFDDPPSAQMLDPALTTVRQPLREIAGKAYQVIQEMIDKKLKWIPSYVLPAELVVRQSTGRVSNR